MTLKLIPYGNAKETYAKCEGLWPFLFGLEQCMLISTLLYETELISKSLWEVPVLQESRRHLLPTAGVLEIFCIEPKALELHAYYEPWFKKRYSCGLQIGQLRAYKDLERDMTPTTTLRITCVLTRTCAQPICPGRRCTSEVGTPMNARCVVQVLLP